jgi:hypothetical protein
MRWTITSSTERFPRAVRRAPSHPTALTLACRPVCTSCLSEHRLSLESSKVSGSLSGALSESLFIDCRHIKFKAKAPEPESDPELEAAGSNSASAASAEAVENGMSESSAAAVPLKRLLLSFRLS